MEQAIHPYVSEIVAAATLERDRYALPEKALKGIEAKLRTIYLEEVPLFVHLVVTASRLRKAGLPVFADQLKALATIGLENKLNPQRPRAPVEADEATQTRFVRDLKPAPKSGVGLRQKPPKK
jgi:hypothetical protein